jgi:hypothetical protein
MCAYRSAFAGAGFVRYRNRASNVACASIARFRLAPSELLLINWPSRSRCDVAPNVSMTSTKDVSSDRSGNEMRDSSRTRPSHPKQHCAGPWRERRRCQPSQRAYFSAPGAQPGHDGNKRSRIRVNMIGYRSSEREATSLHARGLRADSRDMIQCAVSRATIPRPTPCFDAHATRIAPRAINPWRSVTVPPDSCRTATVLPAPRPLGSKTRKASFP